MKTVIQIKETDQVATATTELLPDDKVVVAGTKSRFVFEVKEKIPMGHKVALKDIEMNEEIYKYGEVIGTAIDKIPSGYWVHVQNCKGIKGRRNNKVV